MSKINCAFKFFTQGKFCDGLKELGGDCDWSDDDLSLNGPFFLGFPGKSGWGEGLLVASLIKRYAAKRQKSVPAFADKPICSILSKCPDFSLTEVKCYKDARRRGARSPFAVLKDALIGDLLADEFVPIEFGTNQARRARTSQTNSGDRKRIGVAWASIDNKKVKNSEECEKYEPIDHKTVPEKEFAKILYGIDATVVSFQRRIECITNVDEKFRCRIEKPMDSDSLDSCDQTEVVKQLLTLDCMITISTTTAHMAAAFGIPTVLLTARREGPQWFWPAQACFDKKLYPKVKVVMGSGDKRYWWKPCIDHAQQAVNGVFRPESQS